MPFIPTKSVACMSTSWLLGNVYTTRSYKGKKARSWRFKTGTSQLRETTLTENIGPPGAGRGADNPTLEKTLVTKCEEAIPGYFSWQRLLRKTRTHVGLSSQWRWRWWSCIVLRVEGASFNNKTWLGDYPTTVLTVYSHMSHISHIYLVCCWVQTEILL
jgi:hypothetical protein